MSDLYSKQSLSMDGQTGDHYESDSDDLDESLTVPVPSTHNLEVREPSNYPTACHVDGPFRCPG